MTEFIGCAPDEATFTAAAQALGFTNPDGSIKSHGTWPGSKGSWQLAVVPVYQYPTGNMVPGVGGPDGGTIQVPEMATAPGYWARLRWNEGPLANEQANFLAGLRANGLTVYEQVTINSQLVWSVDGVTPAPDWIDGIGRIA